MQQIQLQDGSRRESIEHFAEAVKADVALKVVETVEQAWQRGKRIVLQSQHKHSEQIAKLSGEVAQCVERQKMLEEENAQLKQALGRLTDRFALVGNLLQSLPSQPLSPMQHEAASTVAPSSPARVSPGGTGASSCADSPETIGTSMSVPLSVDSAISRCSTTGGALPELPPFPFSSKAATPVQGTPKQDRGGFRFAISKADNFELGLTVSPGEGNRYLLVEGIRAGGAVEAWNRQCVSSDPEKIVCRGDLIVGVNSVTQDANRMLKEVKEQQLLSILIRRGCGELVGLPPCEDALDPAAVVAVPLARAVPPSRGAMLAGDAGVAEATSTTAISMSMRAGAPVFVPLFADDTGESGGNDIASATGHG